MDATTPAWNNVSMTYPRSHLVSEEEPAFYHVISRCVRRAFLCGEDKLTGQCFEHRRQWIEERILGLAECFAVSVYAYAVAQATQHGRFAEGEKTMRSAVKRVSNHFHIVVHVDPAEAQSLSDKEVANRWLTAFPGPLKHDDDPKLAERFELAILGNPDRLAELRKRLGSLSWFMKALNEPIARWANQEDDCKGRFWEGRFKCQALLEEQAVVSAMAYVDLNPVRAGMADTLEGSAHTSVQARLKERAKSRDTKATLSTRPLKPVAGLDADALVGMSEFSYLELVQ